VNALNERKGPLIPAFLLVFFGLFSPVPWMAWASDESELLVAKGQVAYHQGRYEEAQTLLEQAVKVDPEDAEAHYSLGVVLKRLERWDEAAVAFEAALVLRPDFDLAQRGLEMTRRRDKREPAALSAEAEKVAPIDEITRIRRPELLKRWEVHAATGLEYDSNVLLAPRGNAGKGVSDPGDMGVILSGGGRYDLVTGAKLLLRAEYDIYQVWRPNIRDFDFQSHRPRGTVSFAIRPSIWAGAQGGYSYYRLGNGSFLGEPFAFPFLSFVHGGKGLTQITYRHGETRYFGAPFENLRDGRVSRVGASHTFYGAGGKYLTLGYGYGQEDPSPRFLRGPVTESGVSYCRRDTSSDITLPCPRDFKYSFNEVSVAAGFGVWWRMLVDVMYLYHYDEYTEPNSVAGFRKRRYDSGHNFFAQVLRPIGKHLRVAVAYFGTINPSNIGLYDYRRNVVSGTLEVVY
jgi:tetratricopeptide (TPR) repeat protein